MAGNLHIKNSNGNTITLQNPDTNFEDRTVDLTFQDNILNPVATSAMTSGTITLDEFTVEKGAGTFLYTGNGTSQDIVTGIPSIDFTVSGNGTGYWFDRSVNQVKTDAGVHVEEGECLASISSVTLKSRSTTGDWHIFDGLRGANNYLIGNIVDAESAGTLLTSFNTNGVTVSTSTLVNNSGVTYVGHQELFTHVKWGTTSSDKFYIEAYNPITRANIMLHIGDGTADHTIPHSLGVELDYQSHREITTAGNWQIKGKYFQRLLGNSSNADELDNDVFAFGSSDKLIYIETTDPDWNALNSMYYIVGRSASKTWNTFLVAGTGTADNFVETVDSEGVPRRPSRVIVKSTVGTIGSWVIFDNKRPQGGASVAEYLLGDTTGAKTTASSIACEFTDDGFTVGISNISTNSSSGQYVAFVEFDTNSDGGDSYFDKPSDDSNLNITDAEFTYTDGKTKTGFNLSTESITTDTIDFSGVSDGFVYVYRDLDGNYGFDSVEPSFDISTGYYEGEASAKSYIAKVMVVSETPQYVDESWINYKANLPATKFDGQVNLSKNVKIIEFGTVYNNKRYVVDNPFGNENYEGCIAKLQLKDPSRDNVWFTVGQSIGGGTSVGDYGCIVDSVEDGIALVTAQDNVYHSDPHQTSLATFSDSGDDLAITSALARVIVYYIGDAE